MPQDFRLHRNSLGRLVFTGPDGIEHAAVEPARAFPITAPREEIALLGPDGHQLAWIPRLDDLTDETRRLLEEELAELEFIPEILRVRSASGHTTPCTWHVDTDRGATSFTLKAEEDIRRIAAPALLVADSRGIQFLIRDPKALDATSRKILERFL